MTACEQVFHLGVRTTLQGASKVSRNSPPIYLASPFVCHSRMISNHIPNEQNPTSGLLSMLRSDWLSY